MPAYLECLYQSFQDLAFISFSMYHFLCIFVHCDPALPKNYDLLDVIDHG